nr:hypothetical protein [Tanacetum cinerariifolium]
CQKAFAFNIGWTLDPLIFGDYPEEMHAYLGSELPTTGNRAIMGFVDTVGERDGVLIGALTGSEGSYVVPRGMEKIVNTMKIRYNNLPMYITENGYSSPDVHEQQVNELLNDVKRVEYHTTYLSSLAKSISLLESQRLDKNKEGLGYSDVHPPLAQIYSPPNKDMPWTGLLEFVDNNVTDYRRPAHTVESSPDDAQNRNPSVTATKASPCTISPKPFIKFVKGADCTEVKTNKVKVVRKSSRVQRLERELKARTLIQKIDRGRSRSACPPAQLYLSPKKDLSWTSLPKYADDTVTDYSRPSPTVESTSGDDQNRNSSSSENGESTDCILSKSAVKFMKAVERSTTNKVETTISVSLTSSYVSLNLNKINASLTLAWQTLQQGQLSNSAWEHFFISSGKITLAVGTLLHYQWQNNSSSWNSAVGMIFTNSGKILH